MPEIDGEHTSSALDYLYQLHRKGPHSWSFTAVKPGFPDDPVGVIRFGAVQQVGRRQLPVELWDVWDVYSLIVEREHRGRGIATHLHSLALDLTLSQGKRLRVVRPPREAHASLFAKLRAQRIQREGGEHLPGVSAVDPKTQDSATRAG